MTLSTAEQLVTLAELARLDQKHKVNVDRLEALPVAAKKHEATAEKLKGELDSVGLKKGTAEQIKRTSEAEVTDERHKIRKWESRASDIKGEREHTALSSEIGGAKRHIRELEDVILEQMESIEAADKDIAALTKKHAAAVADAKDEWEKVSGDIAALKAELEASQKAKDALLEKLPAQVVKRYTLIASRKQGVGVAVITDKDVCGACSRAVPPQLSIQVQKGQVIESCPACNRLLVHSAMTAVVVDGENHA
jgi:predicted  nucleic acid-binding Zn-ribbon protein